MTYPEDAERLDPDAEGLPSVADDTSSAYDDASGRTREDTAPALPGDEPVAVDDYGITEAESRRDEPLEQRLLREQPEVSPEDIDDSLDSIDLNEPSPRRIGRLVDSSPDGLADDESQAIATDSGETLGLSAEEAAMHEVRMDEEEGND